MKEVIVDTLLDALKILPFLFIAFLIIELFEHKLGNKTKKIISKSGKSGPIIGSFLGLFPQCGFSVMATNLYITRIISLGTLISIYLSTSDEMLPILLSNNVNVLTIIKILAIKFLIGMISGFIIDLLLQKKHNNKNYDICEDDHCSCENGIFISTLIHTFKTIVFIMLISFVLNVFFAYVGEENLIKLFRRNVFLGPFISALFGLIPNCGSSIMITELYLNNILTLGSMISGLLSGSGVAILILFKSNKNLKENLFILGIIYFIGVVSGIIINVLSLLI